MYKAQESQLFNPCVSNVDTFFHSSISCLPPPERQQYIKSDTTMTSTVAIQNKTCSAFIT